MIGTKLGTYEITAQIGEGGMGVVYQAKDSQLGRQVALKLLPEAFTADPERTARFEREAKLLASLNHPNIAQIYGFEASGETRALVMELVEGPTLADRLESGSLPLDECLSVARQIAEALEEAHEKGIIHRDLKPQNVKASIEGKVKVLDFGLAKAMDPTVAASGAASASQLAASPTLTLGATVQGVILGTAAYMSPEQAAGNIADRRSDVWSFGVVLYEMLVGRRLFEGETVSHVLASVLKEEPDFSLLPDEVPPRVRRLVRRCLRKKPRERLQAIGDARLVLEEVLAGATDETVGSAAVALPLAPPPKLWPLRAWLAALALSTVALGAYVVLARPAPPKPVRATVLPPPDVAFHLVPQNPGPIALSPDGRHLAFTGADADGRPSLWVRSVDVLEARELPATEGAQYPFWSPDSKQLGFFTGDHLKKITVAGGPPVTLAKASAGKGGSWSPRGVIVFAPAPVDPLSVVSTAGGEAKPLTAFDEKAGDTSHRHPRFLPDGERFLFVARRPNDQTEIRVGSLDGSPPVPLVTTPANAEYAAGRLLFLRETTLMAQPFDPESLRLSGEAVPIVENLLHLGGAELAVFTTSAEGTLAYQTGTSATERRLVWRDRDGKEVGTLGDLSAHDIPRISPDGSSVVVAIVGAESGEPDLWIYDVRRGLRSRFTFDPAWDGAPSWSPDGQQIVFTSGRDGATGDLWIAPAAGTEPPRRFASAAPRGLEATSWSPDGRWLVGAAWGAGAPNDIVKIPAAGGAPEPLIARPEFGEGPGLLSPDGRWLAYRSNETGRDEVYVTAFPQPGRKWQVSQGEGHMPTWRRDGREIFYRDAGGLYAAEVDGRGAVFEVGAVRRIFDLPARFSPVRQYDVAADGQRFLVVEPLGSTAASPVTLFLHWDAELPKP